MLYSYPNYSLQLDDEEYIIAAGQPFYTVDLPLDTTVGLNTRLVFIHGHDVDVSVSTNGDNNIQITKNTDLNYTLAIVEGSAVSIQNHKSK